MLACQSHPKFISPRFVDEILDRTDGAVLTAMVQAGSLGGKPNLPQSVPGVRNTPQHLKLHALVYMILHTTCTSGIFWWFSSCFKLYDDFIEFPLRPYLVHYFDSRQPASLADRPVLETLAGRPVWDNLAGRPVSENSVGRPVSANLAAGRFGIIWPAAGFLKKEKLSKHKSSFKKKSSFQKEEFL